jgi:hypothetical protein
LFKITKAPITPGIHPHKVNKKIIKKEPQPLSITDNGGNRMANNTRKKLIEFYDLSFKKFQHLCWVLSKYLVGLA